MLIYEVLKLLEVDFLCPSAGSFKAFLERFVFLRKNQAYLLESRHLPVVQVCLGESSSHRLAEILSCLKWRLWPEERVACRSLAPKEPLEVAWLKGLSLVEAKQPKEAIKSNVSNLLRRDIQEACECSFQVSFADFPVKVDVEGFEGILRIQLEVALLKFFNPEPLFDLPDNTFLPLKAILYWLPRVIGLVIHQLSMMNEIIARVLNKQRPIEFLKIDHANLVLVHEVEDLLERGLVDTHDGADPLRKLPKIEHTVTVRIKVPKDLHKCLALFL